MAKKNWYMEAHQSKDSEIKELLKTYNELDANSADYESQKEILISTIKEKLSLIVESYPEKIQIESDTDAIDAELDESETQEISESAENAHDDLVKDNSQEEPAVDTAEPEKVFGYTEEDAAKAQSVEYIIQLKKVCREEIQRLENTRLKHGTYKQNRELDRKIWDVRRIIGIALKREMALKERARHIRNMGRISSIAIKRARFVKLMRQGISITNITKHPQGVKKEELVEVLNSETLEACKKNNSKFPEMWERWKAKFLDNKTEKKQ